MALALIALISSLLVVDDVVDAAALKNVAPPANLGTRPVTIELVNDSVDLVAMRKRTDLVGNFFMVAFLCGICLEESFHEANAESAGHVRSDKAMSD
jgi:hypothetical protein